MSAPERIWLEPCCDDAEISWCVHKLDDCDECGEISHEYIRLDLHEAAVAQLKLSRQFSVAEHDVLAERSRQFASDGWDANHDDAHTAGELARAGACYAWISAQSHKLRSLFDRPPPTWPSEWDAYWWKPTTPRRDLVKAAALIIAEIERLDRLCARELAALKGAKP